MSVLRAALPAAAEAARAAPPPMVTVGACNICWALVAADAPAEPETVARVVQLLVRALVSPAQRRSGAASDMAFATVQATVLATLARLLVSDYRNRPAARDAVAGRGRRRGGSSRCGSRACGSTCACRRSRARAARGRRGGGGRGGSLRARRRSRLALFAAGDAAAPLHLRAALRACRSARRGPPCSIATGALGPDLAGAEGAARSAAGGGRRARAGPTGGCFSPGSSWRRPRARDDAPPARPRGARRARGRPPRGRCTRSSRAQAGAGRGRGWAGLGGATSLRRARVAGALACAGARLSAADAGVDLAVHLALLPPAPPAAGGRHLPGRRRTRPAAPSWLRAVAASLLAPIAALFAPGPAPGARLLFPRPARPPRAKTRRTLCWPAPRAALAGLARLLRGWGGDGPGSGALLPAAGAAAAGARARGSVGAADLPRGGARRRPRSPPRARSPPSRASRPSGPAAGTAAAGLRAAIAEPLVGAAAQVLTDRGAAAADGAEAHALLLALLLSAPEAGPDEGGEEGEMQEWEAPRARRAVRRGAGRGRRRRRARRPWQPSRRRFRPSWFLRTKSWRRRGAAGGAAPPPRVPRAARARTVRRPGRRRPPRRPPAARPARPRPRLRPASPSAEVPPPSLRARG